MEEEEEFLTSNWERERSELDRASDLESVQLIETSSVNRVGLQLEAAKAIENQINC